ncbi:MAG: 1-deoxy-D-xylulose-5-phosphate reductoisomerase [Candidatus Omnitrophica bacterium]|nr:1-deoxy-D-xylulose-5-phosphate reductoisomerase [Candidatus Omnitrophota bacterium]MBU1869865.1 1-deoxy-D-xylulose-5-phosphate reductoisomerase [Candidatus Omnitrophota bacterium]
MKHIAILGSTGSIGRSALRVIKSFPDIFRVTALSAHSNIELLEEQIKLFRPEAVAINDDRAALRLSKRIGAKTRILVGQDGLTALCKMRKVDRVLLAISGSRALKPLLTAINNGKDVALANKEALVMAGPLIMRQAAKNGSKILPVDSEQSAIWQCLDGEDHKKLKGIILTASGGPFRRTRLSELKKVSVSKVLRHPRWKMGAKITVDSATLLNKGLELLEAMFLFGLPCDKVKVVVHPEAIIHSMVEFIDGVILAQMSVTDMRIPIQYALSYPERYPCTIAGVDFWKLGKLHFEKPDFKKFPCLGLSYKAAQDLGTMPAVLNAANEVAVEEFLNKKLDFLSIPKVIERVMLKHKNVVNFDLKDVFSADSWARQEAQRFIKP